MIYCTLLDYTHKISLPLSGMLDKTASFRLTSTLDSVAELPVHQLPDIDFTNTPIFYVATPTIAADLADLTRQGAKQLVVLSENPADAAIAYDHDAVDFLLLPIGEQRLQRCFDKLTRSVQQANDGYADSFHRLSELTKTQRVVLRKIGEQKTTRQIADELFLSQKTIDTHRSNIRELLQFSERRPLTPFALLAVQRRLL